MSSKRTSRRARTDSNVTTQTPEIDFDSLDLDMFDQLANRPQKKKSSAVFDEYQGEYEEETPVLDEEEKNFEEFEEEEEIVPVRRRSRVTSRAPGRVVASETVTVRTPTRSSKTSSFSREPVSSRSSSSSSRSASRQTVSPRQKVDTSDSPRSPYGFPVRTTGPSPTTVNPDFSEGWSMSAINGTQFQTESTTDNSATPSEQNSTATAHTCVVRKKKSRLFRFCKFVFTLAMVVAGGWAIYGVSVESNLGFWKQTFHTEIAFVTNTLQSLPVPPLMMIDQP